MATSKIPSVTSLREPPLLLATWFGVGLAPFAPGTCASVAALPFAWLIDLTAGTAGLALASAVLFAIGVWSASVYIAKDGDEDPAPVVIDEVFGQWLTLLVAEPDIWAYAAGLVLFRCADVWKPWPASWADRKLKGGWGVMIDDAIAAAYAAAGLHGLQTIARASGLWP